MVWRRIPPHRIYELRSVRSLGQYSHMRIHEPKGYEDKIHEHSETIIAPSEVVNGDHKILSLIPVDIKLNARW